MAHARKQVRGKPLVAKVMAATIAEMARVGPEGLSIEDVAARADVNKTTIYRRWPTPQVLARQALLCASESSSAPIDTGSLRGDLSEWAREFRRIARSPDMQAIIRMRFGASAGGRMSTLTSDLEEKKHARSKAVIHRAVRRGELPRGTDVELLHDVVHGALLYLVVFSGKRSDEARLERAVRLILEGALGSHGKGRREPAPRKRRPTRA
jgi:AcrR family transcriptional regulator